MYLGRVVGSLWSTVKNPHLNGQRLLIVQPMTPELTATGRRLIATDWTGAGSGELVYYCRGKECSFAFLPAEVPTDANIVGIVDSLHVNRAAQTDSVLEDAPVQVEPEPAAALPPPESHPKVRQS
jgi:ethanolamine utilization protein EutN